MRLILSFSCLIIAALAADQLLFVQSLWRHGDRTPTGTYKNDPYQEDFWGMPWGELTVRGMKQQFLQGQNIRKLYVDQLKFLSTKYNRDEVVVTSATTPRCLQSAEANMAGFFAGSPTSPAGVSGWPSSWTPVPIHNIPGEEDKIMEPGSKCDRAVELEAERVLKKSFLDFIASHWNLFAEIMQHGGDTISVEFNTLTHIYQAISVEKHYYNLTLPSWITDDIYNQLETAVRDAADYVVGAAGFDHPEDTELLRLNGGFLLQEWINNFNQAKSGGEKYKAYSAHDSTITALLHTLGAKFPTIDKANPEYASTVTSELWKRDDGSFAVKFQYIDDAYSTPRPITKNIKGCPTDSDLCPLDTFITRSKDYLPSGARPCNPFGQV